MVPRFTEFYIPVLQVMSNIEPIEINDLIDKVADHINLSKKDRLVTTGSGNQYRYRSNISWAVTDLNQGNFIERMKRGYYVITLSGLELLEENLKKINRDVLAARSESFRAFIEKKGTRKGKNTTNNKSSNEILIDDVVDEMAEENCSEITLDELYSIRETLVKAKISTNEIDVKIKELETDSFFNTLLSRLYKLLPDILGNNKKKVSFMVEYIPDDEISIKIGETRKTKRYYIEETNNLSSKDTLIGTAKNENQKKVYEKKSLQNENLSKSQQIKKQEKKVREDKFPALKGVWIEPYNERLIIVKGDTDPFRDLFVSYGGRFINNPKDGKRGWIFMCNREEGLRKDLSGYLISAPVKIKSSTLVQSSTEKIDEAHNNSYDYQVTRYLELFNSLRSFNFLGITGPHKAILLIAIFKGIRTGLFQDNKIVFSSELESLYNNAWNLYVGGLPTLGAVYPFVHLGRESFFLHKLRKPINDYDKTWSRYSLERHIDYSVMDKKLVDMVKEESIYNKIIDFLTNRYCSKSNEKETIQSIQFNIINDNSIISPNNLRESFETYALKTTTKHGKLYSKQSVQIYINSLISDSMNEIVSEFHIDGDIYDINDIDVLLAIKQKVDGRSIHDKSLVTSRSALALYIKFIQTQISID